MSFSIKEIILHYARTANIAPEELAQYIGISRNCLYVRFREPSSWRLGELNDLYNWLKVPEEERRYEK